MGAPAKIKAENQPALRLRSGIIEAREDHQIQVSICRREPLHRRPENILVVPALRVRPLPLDPQRELAIDDDTGKPERSRPLRISPRRKSGPDTIPQSLPPRDLSGCKPESY